MANFTAHIFKIKSNMLYTHTHTRHTTNWIGDMESPQCSCKRSKHGNFEFDFKSLLVAARQPLGGGECANFYWSAEKCWKFSAEIDAMAKGHRCPPDTTPRHKMQFLPRAAWFSSCIQCLRLKNVIRFSNSTQNGRSVFRIENRFALNFEAKSLRNSD